MKKQLMILSITMIISFILSAIFFFNSGVFDFNYGYVTGDNAKNLGTQVENFFSIKLNGESCEIKQISQELNYSLEEISKIYMSSISTDIKIISTENSYSSFKLEGVGCNHQLKSFVEGGDLNLLIEYPTYQSWFSGVNTNLELEVFLPINYSKDLAINSVSGEVYIEFANLSHCEIHSISGDLRLKNFFCLESYLKTTSGEIGLNLGNLEKIKTTSGDVFLEEVQIGKNSLIETVSGEIKMSTTENSNFNLNFETVSGDFDGMEKKGQGDYELNVKTVSGDLEIF